MSRKLIILISLLTFFCRNATGQVKGQAEGVIKASGTLVVGLATKSGFVICADKRTYDYLRGDLDTEVKIVQLSPTAALASTGYPAFYDILTDSITNQRTLRLAYNAEDVTKGYFLKNAFRNADDFWRGLASTLIEQFETFLHARPFSFWPETGNPPDNALFQLGIFYLDSSHKPAATYIRFCYVKNNPPSINVFKAEEDQSSFEFVKPAILGNTAVYNELVSGRDKRFDDIRSDKMISRFLKGKPQVKTVTVSAGLNFARRFIKITSERSHLIENTPFHVGPTTDCAVLNYKDGFKWLSMNYEYIEPKRIPGTRKRGKRMILKGGVNDL